CAMRRPTMSVEPPGEKPSIRRTVLLGYACANALLASSIAAHIEINPRKLLVRISPPHRIRPSLYRSSTASDEVESLRSQFGTHFEAGTHHEPPYRRELPRRVLRALLRHPRARARGARRPGDRMAALR